MSEQLTTRSWLNGSRREIRSLNLLVVRYQHKVASLVSRYVPSGDVPDVYKKLLLKPIVRWIRSGEIALFIHGCIGLL
ncbi:RNA polymerase sigma factor RpoE [Escherichia coli]|nr:RNA polymerase sigma factor RpoE [Escherichia coli]